MSKIEMLNNPGNIDYEENIKLKKKIAILEAENKQLAEERLIYKDGYDRWANNKFARILKKVLKRDS